MTANTPLKEAGRAFSMYASRLEKLNIYTLGDLLLHMPSRYEDYSNYAQIAHASPEQTVTVQGRVTASKNTYTRSKLQIQKVEITDETGVLECVWFNQPFVVKGIHVGDTLSVAGRVEQFGAKFQMTVKEYEVLKENGQNIHTGRLLPIYPETRGVSSRWIRNRAHQLIESLESFFPEYMPQNLLKKHSLLALASALRYVHQPKTIEDAMQGKQRLAYDELFFIQLAQIYRRAQWKEKKVSPAFRIPAFKKEITAFIASLPFSLTGAQSRAIEEITNDVQKTTPMNRLLQGDVGSGKTIVAAVAMYIAKLNGFQSVLMAPTQILAEQHFETIHTLFSALNISVELVTGNTKATREPSDILVGTHALIHKNADFSTLGFIVVDEQHRFGVEQRSILRDKGNTPHFLSMTATPIPRTAFLTMYGDLSLSVLDELPKGRQKIKTWLVPNEKRDDAYTWIKKQINELDTRGNRNQVFIVCPFIEESESMQTVRAATKEFEYLKKEVFGEFSVGLLHGKMKVADKQAILSAFQNGTVDILVSTPVVEVGIDIPNATVMVIEGAERFGLASLHQLRGRVGRSDKQSYCLLFTETESAITTQRLKSLETTHTGAALAEIDLANRGAGDMFGTQQHGTKLLKFADFSDPALIRTTQVDAQDMYKNLDSEPLLQERLKSTIIRTRVNPD